MKKKKILIIMGCITAIVVGVLLCFYITNSSEHKFIIGVNNKELNEDINSIRSTGEVINAKIDQSSDGIVYKGEGYTIIESPGGDCIEYQIFQGEKLIWEYTLIVPLTTMP